MIKKFKTNDMKVPILCWADYLDDKTYEQIREVSKLPFLFHHVALMGDCHLGYGVPIGGVVATQGIVVPNFVGVDIGCGMQCCKLPKSLIPKLYREDIEEICKRAKEIIPVGFNHNKEGASVKFMPPINGLKDKSVVWEEYESARHQLGTLGGGNHFIEIQEGDDECFYLMVHSGSRNLGNKVAKHYHKVAVDEMQKYKIGVPKDLSYLPLDTEAGKMYMKEMNYCVDFAFRNRQIILNRVLDVVIDVLQLDQGLVLDVLDVPHNYAAMEHHFGTNVLVHRKGATKAYDGKLGIIPGSQGTPSFIVEGLGNPMSFKSCSHGAGRTMSRSKAKDNLSLIDELKKMEGIVHGMTDRSKLDEAPGSYKNIESVMKNQEDLVRIKTRLTPLGVIKA